MTVKNSIIQNVNCYRSAAKLYTKILWTELSSMSNLNYGGCFNGNKMNSSTPKIEYIMWGDYFCLILNKHRDKSYPVYFRVECLSPNLIRFKLNLHEDSSLWFWERKRWNMPFTTSWASQPNWRYVYQPEHRRTDILPMRLLPRFCARMDMFIIALILDYRSIMIWILWLMW